MSTAARIEELRKKFEENPRRYFAPLANELRKAGDLSQAIALCREHLPKQPGHMSGYIVFGQALYETAELEEARGVFEQALSLDPENLIALRHLGDIARRQGQPQVARRWYERVLEADPRNDDIAAQLASLATPAYGTPAYGAPVQGTPAWTPAQSAPAPTPAYGAPSYGAPAYATPPVPSAAIPNTASPTPIAAQVAVPTPVAPAPAIPTPISAAPAIPTPIAGISAVPTPIDNAALPSAMPIDFDGMLTLTPVSTPVVAPLDGFNPTHITPASPTPALGFASVHPAMPTPDAAMRAIEPPSYLQGEASTAVPDTSFADIPSEGLLDIDALGGIGVPTDSAAADSIAHSVSEATDADPFAFGAVAHDASTDALVADELAAAGDEAAMAFEEGLVAPEWPDTSELVARRDMPRYATPISVPVTTEAVEAFGREADDPVNVPLPEPEPDIEEASVYAAAVHDHVVESVDSTESVVEAPAHELVDEYVPEHVHEHVNESVEDEADIVTAADTSEVESQVATTSLVTPPHVPAYAFDMGTTSGGFDVDELVGELASQSEVSELDPFETVEQATEQSVSAEASFADVLDAVESSVSDEVATDASVVAERVAEEPAFDDSSEEPAAEEAHEASPAFVTETMGELLVAQGFIDRAITVYEELVRRRPYDPVLSSRLSELRDMQEESRAAAAVVQTPVVTSVPTPVAAFTPVSTYTPVASRTPIAPVPAVAAFTARERFAALAARRVARRTPPRSTPAISDAIVFPTATTATLTPVSTPVINAAVTPPAEDSLAALFGSESHSDDDLAAQQLAEAFNPDAVDVGTLSDSFFAGAAGHREPTPAFGISRQPTPVRSATPIASPAVSPTPASAPAAPVNTGEFSFDRFFPDPARQANASGNTAGGGQSGDAPASGAPAADDLAQFSAWLKGLGNS
ncbi:MAG: tetratricopeptide repeat protein [Gemmatimonadaceae bacterium]|nr:tetratricopeptide repeat protein [Gemmatimonadaceae bacterium]